METVASETHPSTLAPPTGKEHDLGVFVGICGCGFCATSQFQFWSLGLRYVSYCLYVLQDAETESMIKGFPAELRRALTEPFPGFLRREV